MTQTPALPPPPHKHTHQEVLTYTKGVIRIRKSKDRQHNGQKKKDKQQSTKHTHKTKDRITRIPLKTECERRFSGRLSNRTPLQLTDSMMDCNILYTQWNRRIKSSQMLRNGSV